MADFWPKFGNLPRQGPSQEPNRISLTVEKLPINVVIFDSENDRKWQLRYKMTTNLRRKSHLKKPQSTTPHLSLTWDSLLPSWLSSLPFHSWLGFARALLLLAASPPLPPSHHSVDWWDVRLHPTIWLFMTSTNGYSTPAVRCFEVLDTLNPDECVKAGRAALCCVYPVRDLHPFFHTVNR